MTGQAAGMAQPRPVEGGHAIARGKPGHQRMGHVADIAAGTVDEDQVGPLSHLQGMDRHAVDLEDLPLGRKVPRRAAVMGPGAEQGRKARGAKAQSGPADHLRRRSVLLIPIWVMSKGVVR